jgi:methylthioribulose-1-phosphate dehydratase
MAGDEATHVHLTHLEMMKGIWNPKEGRAYRYFDHLRVPIIENTAEEAQLRDRLASCIRENPETQAVLVRRHGVYVWGDSWQQAKGMAECFDYLFQVYVEMKRMGMDPGKRPIKCLDDHHCEDYK